MFAVWPVYSPVVKRWKTANHIGCPIAKWVRKMGRDEDVLVENGITFNLTGVIS
jgi:hypothetical protein